MTQENLKSEKNREEKPIINDEIAKQIKERFNKTLKNPVYIDFYYDERDESEYIPEIKKLLREMSEIEEKIKVSEHNVANEKDITDIKETPLLILTSDDHKARNVRFRGAPLYYEFASFLESIEALSTGNTGLKESTVNALKNLDEEVDVKIYTTLECKWCPIAVGTFHRFAVVSEKIRSEMVDSIEFLEEADRVGVNGVPHTVINGKIELVGAKSEDEFLENVIMASTKE
ncbi:protein disulfide oxidoreductase [Caldiplasma sukawensis]